MAHKEQAKVSRAEQLELQLELELQLQLRQTQRKLIRAALGELLPVASSWLAGWLAVRR